MLNEKARFTIGQFAALHGINKKTLMWYDEIGLFKPAVINEENGYRYYSYRQSSRLETILMLRDLNVPLEKIQTFLSNRSAAGMESLLKMQMEEIDRNISKLRAIRQGLAERHKEAFDLLHTDLSEILVIEKTSRCLITVETSPDTSLEKEIEKMVEQIQKYRLPRMYSASYGSMISAEALYKGDFEAYTRLFIELPPDLYPELCHQQPNGTYIQAFCKGNWDRLPARYEEILHYAEENRLILTGYAYETGVNQMMIDRAEDYITKIEIPCQKMSNIAIGENANGA